MEDLLYLDKDEKIIKFNPLQGLDWTEHISPFDPENPVRKRWMKLWEKTDFDPTPVESERLRKVRFGMITNLISGKNKHKNYNRVLYENIICHQGIVRESGSLKNLPEIIHEFKESGVNVIIVNGGDGTMGAVATEVFHTWEGEMPAFVPLRGGTMNATAAAIGIPRTPSAVLLDRLVRVINSKQGGLIEHWIGTLRVNDPRRPRDTFGFVFANGLAYEYDRYIYSLGDTGRKNAFIGFLLLNLHGLFGTRLGEEVWRNIPAKVTIDGKPLEFDTIKILVASTIYNLPLFLRPFPPPPSAKEGGFTFLINGMRRKEIFKNTYSLLSGKYRGKNHLTGQASEIKLKMNGGYMIDGELWAHNDDVEITVSFGIPLRVWWFEQPAGLFW
ncbi:MAG: hypothetical protein Kow0090_03410 [Myxococcota bacterium]